jgi:hypothetical protein
MSTLHHHFRALRAMSPLQYQKQLRLVAARERMLIEGLDAASAAFEVGTKARISSIASTNASSVNRRCATLRPAASPSLQCFAIDERPLPHRWLERKVGGSDGTRTRGLLRDRQAFSE